MSREFKSRDKTFHKMTRDGLMERNAVTGDEKRATTGERDLNLRTEQLQNTSDLKPRDNTARQPQSLDNNAPSRPRSLLESIRQHSQQERETRPDAPRSGDSAATDNPTARQIYQSQTENVRKFVDDGHSTPVTMDPLPKIATGDSTPRPIQPSEATEQPSSAPPQSARMDGDIRDKPFEAAKPTERSHEARSREKPAGSSSDRFDIRKKSAQNEGEQAQSAQQGQTEPPTKNKVASQHGRLQFNSDKTATPAPTRQSGKKYGRKFAQEAVKQDKTQVTENVKPDEKPPTQNVVETPLSNNAGQSVLPDASRFVASKQPGKLLFTKEVVKGAVTDRIIRGSKKKHGKHRQNFTSEARKPTAGETVEKPTDKDNTPQDTASTPDAPHHEDNQRGTDDKRHTPSEKPGKLQFSKENASDKGVRQKKPSAVNVQHSENNPHGGDNPKENDNAHSRTAPRNDDTPKHALYEKSSRLKFDKDDKTTDKPVEKPKKREPSKAAPETDKTTDDNAEAADTDESDGIQPRSRDAPDVKDNLHGRDSFKSKKKADKKPKLKFSEDEKPPDGGGKNAADDKKPPGLQKKADKAGKQAVKANAKLDKAKQKLSKKEKRKGLLPDDAKTKPKDKLRFEKEAPVIVGAPAALVRNGAATASRAGTNKLRQKVHEVEDENVGVKSGHKVEQAAEFAYKGGKRVTRSTYRFIKNKPYRTVAKLEKKAMQANIKYSYRKALLENPKLRSNILSRYMQKRKIKQQYAKALKEAKRAGMTIKKTGSITANAAKAIVGAIKRHPAVVGTIAIALLLIIFMFSMCASVSNMAGGGLGAIFASSYTADDTDLDSSELVYTEWETDLQLKIGKTEQDHPGYDEYKYDIDNISHNPYELAAFLSAVYGDFHYSDMQSVLQQMFNEQYVLTFVPTTETRYRTNPDGSQTAYQWKILTTTLTARSFTDVAFSRMDSDQWEVYGLLMQTKGNRQYIESPFDFNWLTSVTSYYGYRVHPTSGNKDYHKGVDIAVPTGTDIHAGHDGRVTAAAYDSGGYGYYVVIKDDKGLESKYAHCDNILVSVGQEVKTGDVIAKSGNSGNSTGSHLHLEVLKDGRYLNPLYFAGTNDDGSGMSGGTDYGDPGTPMGDGSYAALIAEAEKYLGFPYVFGGSSPSTSFDCSGFVCYVYTKSGTYNLPRTTAQGIYNQCVKIPESEAKPGDLIFFERTYSTTDRITHIGIYVGGGRMLHCGNPIQYTSYMTSYWQSHAPQFGRLIP